jgi:hypothetical protein
MPLNTDSHNAQANVPAGETFVFRARISLDVNGTALVKVIPRVFTTGVCELAEAPSVRGPFMVPGEFWSLVRTPILFKTPTTSDPPHYVGNLIEIEMKLNTNPNAQDQACDIGYEYQQPEDVINNVFTRIGNYTTLVEPIPTPIPMGAVAIQGGDDVDDKATITPPVVADMTVVVAVPHPAVQLTSQYTYADAEPSEDDYGRMIYKKNNHDMVEQQVTMSPSAGIFAYKDPHLAYGNGTAANAIATEYCLWAAYSDGGLWRDSNGPASTCITVHAYRPSVANLKTNFQAICTAANHAAAYAQFTRNSGRVAMLLVPEGSGLTYVQIDAETYGLVCN